MTVTYTAEVSNCSGFGCFLKLLGRWRASIYKLIWMEMLVYLALYYAINFTYRYILNHKQKYIFESVVYYCRDNGSLIPLSFVLGFFVSVVMQRWWNQYLTMPWPDQIAVYVSALLRGQDEHGRVMRRTVMRYVCLCLTMVLTMMSPAVKKRFPTLEHLVDAGLLVESEKDVIKRMDEKFPKYPKHWMPIVWASSIITRARKEGRIWDDHSLKTIIDELNIFRGMCGSMMHYDFISIPLVYTQVVTLVVYSYFLSEMLAQQWTEKGENNLDYYFPLFTTLEFFFYMGWLKVAESLICPFGENDDDFELNWMIDRNLQVSYLIVDEMHHEHPELIRDQYWDEVFPNELPYPSEANNIREEPPTFSTAKLDFSNLATMQSTLKVDESDANLQLFWKRTNDVESTPSMISTSSYTSTLRKRNLNHDAGSHVTIQPPTASTSSGTASQRLTPPIIIGALPPSSRQVIPKVSGNVRIVDLQKQESHIEEYPFVRTDEGPSTDFVSIKYDDGVDYFELLRQQREQEGMVRQRKKVLNLLQNVANLVNTDISLSELNQQHINILPLAITVVSATSSIASITIGEEANEVEPSVNRSNASSQRNRNNVENNKTI